MATPTTPLRLSVLMLVLACGSAAAAEPTELVTAPDAVLCLDAGSLDQAGDGPAAGAQHRLRSLGCLKSPAGVPATLLSGVGGSRQMERPVPAAGDVGRHHDVGPSVRLYVAGRDAAAQSAGGKIVLINSTP